MIYLKNLSKSYLNKKVLNNINLEINDGDFILLVGKNGSGKSTLLKILSGVINPDKKDMISNYNYNIYIPEKFNLPKHINTKDYISYLKDIDNINIEEYINFLEIPNKRISELSKGNLQKLSILTFLSSNINTILLDEPCEGMDINLKNKFVSILKRLNSMGKTIIISTHDIKTYSRINKRIINVINGEIYEDNETQQDV